MRIIYILCSNVGNSEDGFSICSDPSELRPSISCLSSTRRISDSEAKITERIMTHRIKISKIYIERRLRDCVSPFQCLPVGRDGEQERGE